jgi:hypothetical protein
MEFVEHIGVCAYTQSSVSVLAVARAEGASWEPRLLYAKGYQLSSQDSVDNTTDVKVWWSAKQSSDTMPIEARRPDFHDTSNLIIFLRNDILIYSQETFNEGTQS